MTTNYANPLDDFRSYSYHHILTIGNTSEAFRKMVTPFNGKPRVLSAVDKVSIGEKIDIDGDPVYLLVDTRRFSQFSITEVEMEHVYGTGPVSNPSVPSGSMRVKLIDTTGLSFFNFLSDVLRNKLKTTKSSAFFLLTIIFVGHRYDGTTETISICNIPLLLMLMGFKFSSSGTIFDIEFMETEGSAQKGASFEQINSCGTIRSVTTQGGPATVGQMMLNFEKQLNIQSLEFYQKYQNEALGATKEKTASTKEPRIGKLVQYMITLPNTEPYNWADNLKIDIGNASLNSEQIFVNAPAGITVDNPFSDSKSRLGVFTLAVSKTATIADVIKKILESSQGFLKLASADTIKTNNGLTCKIITNVTSNENTYLIHYDVYPVTIPKQVSGQKSNTIGSEVNGLNLIKYDYIFTGKNTHIKDLDIIYKPESAVALDTELDIGANRFKRNAEQGNTKSGVKASSKGAEKSKDISYLLRPNDPIFPPIITGDQQKNNSSSRNENVPTDAAIESFRLKQEYVRNLAFFHFVSSMDLDMTIRGNPNLLRKYADREERGGIAPHGSIIDTQVLESFYKQDAKTAASNYTSSISERLGTSKKQYYTEYYLPRLKKIMSAAPQSSDRLLGKGDIITSPIFVELNIRAPNVDNTGNIIANAPLYTDKFFYNGPYMVLFIKHSLINGEFTQNLNLIPFDVNGQFSTSGDNP